MAEISPPQPLESCSHGQLSSLAKGVPRNSLSSRGWFAVALSPVVDSSSSEEVQARLELLSIKKAGKVVPHPFCHWDISENSLPHPFPCFHEVCGNFTPPQSHSLSSIWLKFPDWHRNYKGGTDRLTGREGQSLWAFNSLETIWKGKTKQDLCLYRSFFSFKGSKVGFCSAFVNKIKDAQPYHTQEGNSSDFPKCAKFEKKSRQRNPIQISRKWRGFKPLSLQNLIQEMQG